MTRIEDKSEPIMNEDVEKWEKDEASWDQLEQAIGKQKFRQLAKDNGWEF